MRTHSLSCLAAVAIVALAINAPGQTTPANANATPHIKFLPHTAEKKNTHVLLRADGAKITDEYTFVTTEDSQGRYMASTIRKQVDGPGLSVGAFVRDPVAGIQFTFRSKDKKVKLYRLPPPEERQGCWLTDDGMDQMSWSSHQPGEAATPLAAPVPPASPFATSVPHGSSSRKEEVDLGTQVIMGVEALGRRITWTTPAGVDGNDQPLVYSFEIWYAPSIGVYVREHDVSPLSGTITSELVSLSLDEPAPSVFRIPEGYEVIAVEMHPIPCAQR
jgi:hypothetical protein